MPDLKNIPEVGAPDPELETSPIAEEGVEETEDLKQELPGAAGCVFNAERYANGTYVNSGGMLLRCDFGIWVPAGSADADNP